MSAGRSLRGNPPGRAADSNCSQSRCDRRRYGIPAVRALLGEFGYGEFPEVITLPQFERLLSDIRFANGKPEWNGRSVESLAMIHCVGSRQIEGVHTPQPDGKVNNYCSRVCCTATVAAANQMRERFPEVNIYDVYQDIRTYGRGHEDYYTKASKNRVTFLRYLAEEIPQVVRAEHGDEHPLLVRVKDPLTWGEEIDLPVDLVVLSVGMMPSPVQDLIGMLKIAPGNDRFLLEVHPKLRPVETAVTGIVLAGTAQGPMNIQESCAAAEAAASKVAILLSRGEVELEPYVARVDPQRCEGAGECVRVCPQEGAIHLETFSRNGSTFQRAVVTPANCNGCGVCVSACPNRAIDVQGWPLDEFEAMVEAIAARDPDFRGRCMKVKNEEETKRRTEMLTELRKLHAERVKEPQPLFRRNSLPAKCWNEHCETHRTRCRNWLRRLVYPLTRSCGTSPR